MEDFCLVGGSLCIYKRMYRVFSNILDDWYREVIRKKQNHPPRVCEDQIIQLKDGSDEMVG